MTDGTEYDRDKTWYYRDELEFIATGTLRSDSFCRRYLRGLRYRHIDFAGNPLPESVRTHLHDHCVRLGKSNGQAS